MLSRLLYYIVLRPVSLLPHWALYRVSDFAYLLFLTVFPYRKKVALDNIQQCFPELKPDEHRRILRKFYRQLADVFVESFKNFTISKKEVHRRMRCTNPELLNDLAGSGKSIALCGGHYTNWEMTALVAPGHTSKRIMGIYKRIKNPWFDKKMRETRGRFGLELVPTGEASEWMAQHTPGGVVVIYAIDQSPADPRKAHWISFLGRDTAAYYGPEKHAREHNMAVVFGHISKLRRGYYSVTYELIADEVTALSKGGVIEAVSQRLEADIRKAPEYWLWTHRRWKHRRPESSATL